MCVFGLYVACSSLGVLFSAKAVSSPLSPDSSQAQVIAKAEAVTLLRFETQHYLVRVFRENDQIYLNVYNKETGFTDQNAVRAMVAPPDNEGDNWRTYMNQQGDLEYRAKVNPEGQTELEIRIVGGPPTVGEPGFNATYSFPHIYLGENVETTLKELKESGWVVDDSEQEQVELTRNQLALNLKFDPNTQVITYTRLIDLT
jgi:hypothetical protein